MNGESPFREVPATEQKGIQEMAAKAQQIISNLKSKQIWAFVVANWGWFVVVGFAIVIMLVLIGGGGKIYLENQGEPTIPTNAAGTSLTCTAWENVPSGYQALFQEASENAFYRDSVWASNNNKTGYKDDVKGIHTALLAAIFLSENGDSWSGMPAYDTGNPIPPDGGKLQPAPHDCDSGGTNCVVGPFQFKESTFGSYKEPGMNEIKSIKDSAFAAANYLYEILRIDAGLKDSERYNNLTSLAESNYIQCAGAGYNGGGSMCSSWRSRNFGSPEPATNDNYHVRVWQRFQELSKSCDVFDLVDTTGGVRGVITEAQKYLNMSRDTYHVVPKDNAVKFNKACKNGSEPECRYGWCAYFATTVYEHVYGTKEVYTGAPESIKTYFSNNHTWIKPSKISDIKPGDIFVTKGYGTSGLHAGLVVFVDTTRGEVHTIEGNTGSTYANGGDKVTMKPRPGVSARKLSDFNSNDNYGVGRWKTN